MDKRYYQILVLCFVVSSLCPLAIFILFKDASASQQHVSTEYHFQTVDGPIQPIPTQITIDKNWVLLGKALFHSPLLSKDNSISCASCHMVNFGGDDGFPLSTGVDNALGGRNSPTVLNATFNFRQFWDGRASDLSEQAVGPIHNPVEMASNWQAIISKLAQDDYFKQTFERLSNDGVTPDNVIKAITIYEQSLITPNSAIDRYLLGQNDALTSQQKRGLKLFVDYGCSTCHQGRNIGGNIYQKLGRIDDIPTELAGDLGLFTVTQKIDDKYVFKVPSLRNIAETALYFHNGTVSELEDAVRIMAQVQLGTELADNEVNDIVALLRSFSAEPLKLEP